MHHRFICAYAGSDTDFGSSSFDGSSARARERHRHWPGLPHSDSVHPRVRGSDARTLGATALACESPVHPRARGRRRRRQDHDDQRARSIRRAGTRFVHVRLVVPAQIGAIRAMRAGARDRRGHGAPSPRSDQPHRAGGVLSREGQTTRRERTIRTCGLALTASDLLRQYGSSARPRDMLQRRTAHADRPWFIRRGEPATVQAARIYFYKGPADQEHLSVPICTR